MPGAQASCTTDAPGGRCALASTADGSYRLRGLSHGSYLIYVDPLNPEYHPLPGAAIVLDRGSTDRYDANLHRLGRFLVTVAVPGGGGGSRLGPRFLGMRSGSHFGHRHGIDAGAGRGRLWGLMHTR